MQEKVVYFLGAGFSFPIGLPVMSDFLIRSKDLFFSDPDKFHRFEEVFETITKMHRAKSHYNVDLFNIEEILSLLEMRYYADPDNAGDRELFTDYLKAVINALTPALPSLIPVPFSRTDWPLHLFGGGSKHLWREYFHFVASLFNLVIRINVTDEQVPIPVEKQLEKQDEPSAQYSVISLNYDMVLEKCLDLILAQCDMHPDIGFARTCKEAEMPGRVPLAKLHGSVDGTIVPPTWNKTTQPEAIQEAWQLAYRVLSEATQIRILGYSLPQTDAYVRYLLESATMEEPHIKNLKHIDVGCLDPDGSVRRRYEEFLCFYRRRFEELDIRRYLEDNMTDRAPAYDPSGSTGTQVRFNKLERTHDRFFKL